MHINIDLHIRELFSYLNTNEGLYFHFNWTTALSFQLKDCTFISIELLHFHFNWRTALSFEELRFLFRRDEYGLVHLNIHTHIHRSWFHTSAQLKERSFFPGETSLSGESVSTLGCVPVKNMYSYVYVYAGMYLLVSMYICESSLAGKSVSMWALWDVCQSVACIYAWMYQTHIMYCTYMCIYVDVYVNMLSLGSVMLLLGISIYTHTYAQVRTHIHSLT